MKSNVFVERESMDSLNIAFISDKGFYLPSVVAMTSLLENKRLDSVYKIFFIVIDFTQEQKDIIQMLADKYCTTIEIIDISGDMLAEKYSNLSKHECCASITALVKFDLPNICEGVDTLLYLDGDIIVKDDLSSLTEITMMGDEYAAVVRDSGLLYSNTLIRQNIDQYFNSGIMLLNLKALREKNIPSLLVEEKFKSEDHSLMDQHVLNKVFSKHTCLLEHKYNLLYMNLVRAKYFYSITLDDINNMFGADYKSWEDMLNRAAIIHYSSFDKPWKYSDVPGVEIWEKYFKLSPLSAVPLKRKVLHMSMINKMLEHKATAFLAIFIWECETKGFRLAIKDSFSFVVSRLKR